VREYLDCWVAALLSPAAAPYLEEMAREAQAFRLSIGAASMGAALAAVG